VSRNLVKEALSDSCFYEMKSVKTTRKVKSCGICSGTIPVGTAHKIAVIFCDSFNQLNICNECKEKYKNELVAMEHGEYDDY